MGSNHRPLGYQPNALATELLVRNESRHPACCYAKGATAIPFTRKSVLRVACYAASQYLAFAGLSWRPEHVPATFAASTTRSTLQEMAAFKPTHREIENLGLRLAQPLFDGG